MLVKDTFDPLLYRLAPLCKRKHEWGNTGKSLRENYGTRHCVFCQGKEIRIRNPITICHSSGIHGFDYSKSVIEVVVKYGIDFDQDVYAPSTKLCRHGHYWQDGTHSLRTKSGRDKGKAECYFCGKISFYKSVLSGKNREIRARYYAAHKVEHNEACMNRYRKNRHAIR
jgi:hypothetical protein